jgi:hypothetical protein
VALVNITKMLQSHFVSENLISHVYSHNALLYGSQYDFSRRVSNTP